MRKAAISIPLLFAFALPGILPSQARMPMMRAVEPASGKVGEVLTIKVKTWGGRVWRTCT